MTETKRAIHRGGHRATKPHVHLAVHSITVESLHYIAEHFSLIAGAVDQTIVRV